MLIGDKTQIDSKLYRNKLREEIRRWHPDKFMQKIRKRINDNDYEIIMLNVTKISQALNDARYSMK